MKLLYIAIFSAITFTAFAADAPTSPTKPQLEIKLNQQDITNLQQFVAGSRLHISMDDGTQHPLIDGSMLLQFVQQKIDAAKKEATVEKTPSEKPK
jgi:hypothetical protein